MKNIFQFILPLFLVLNSCNMETKEESMEKWKDEIRETELNFAKMAKEEGVAPAFLAYAAEDAVLLRNNKVIVGKDAIRTYYENQSTNKDVDLTWKPDFIEVAESGELGYTYGHYTYSFVDSSGSRVENIGIFHTIWKKQPDGKWLFVWD